MLQCRPFKVQSRLASLPVLELGVKFLLSYFLGSLMGSLVIGRLRGGVDIRKMGSGNPGGTNALRTQGWAFALGVIVIDVGKGALAAGLIPPLDLPFVGMDPQLSRAWVTLACAAAAVVGHVWPMWHSFRGGKGAATVVGTLIVLDAWLILPILLVWAWMLTLSGYVGLSTMTAAVFAPFYLALTRLPEEQPLFIYTVVMAVFMIFNHRSNIGRMLAGTESRNKSVMLFRRRRAVDGLDEDDD